MRDDRSNFRSHAQEYELGAAARPGSSRGWLAIAGVTLLAISVIVGGAAFTSAIAGTSDLTKVIAVALFVTAMVALAMGMIGDSFRRPR